MREKTEIVGININNVDMDEAAVMLQEYLDQEGCSTVFTPNSEILVEAVKDRDFEAILNDGDLVVPDGIGVVIASKFYRTPFKERVAGFDLMLRLIEIADSRGSRIYLLGGKPGVAEEAAIKLSEKYGNLTVAGIRDGYFTDDEEQQVIDDVNNCNADILLVALGAPKQEKLIHKYRNGLNVKIAVGVGGSFDVLAGRAKRAPEFYQKAGLEWLYRLAKEPRRIGRVMRLPKFIALAFIDAKFRHQ